MKLKKIGLLMICFFMSICLASCGLLEESDKTPELLSSGGVQDTLVFDELEITVNDFSFSPYLGGLDGLNKVDDGNQYCVVHMNVKNTATSAKEICGAFSNSEYIFSLLYGGKYKYYDCYADYSEFLMAHDTIAPLETLNDVCVCFKVPNEVAENSSESLVIDLCKNIRSDQDYVEWKLR